MIGTARSFEGAPYFLEPGVLMPASPKLSIAIALATLTATVAPAYASVTWRGDFETGDRTQFSSTQMVASDRLQVVSSPTRDGRYALRAEVRQGDDPINASGNRAELLKYDGASEGTEYYYGWSTLFPSDYPLTPTWQVFMQWHHPGLNGAPPVRLVLGCSASDCGQPMPDTLFVIVDGKTVYTHTPITRGDWHDFVLHIKWSANASVGFVELWYDGKLVLPKRMARTLYSSSDVNYLKLGLYRDEATAPTAVLYHDALVQASTYEEAAPPPRASEPVADNGTPAPGTGGQPTPAPDSSAPAPGSQTPPPLVSSGTTLPGETVGCSQGGSSASTWALIGALLLLVPFAARRWNRAAVAIRSAGRGEARR
jgi:hypothetical protein